MRVKISVYGLNLSNQDSLHNQVRGLTEVKNSEIHSATLTNRICKDTKY